MMRNLTLAALIAFVTVSMSACKLDAPTPEDFKNALSDTSKVTNPGTNNPGTGNPGTSNPPNTDSYMTYTVNGIDVTAVEITALRGINTKPRTMTIIGSAKNGAGPKVKFEHQESFIGFERGLNVISSQTTYPSQFVDYTDAAGNLFLSNKSSEDMHFGFFGLSYKKDGEVYGSFSGTIKTPTGTVAITNGKFKTKFSN